MLAGYGPDGTAIGEKEGVVDFPLVSLCEDEGPWLLALVDCSELKPSL